MNLERFEYRITGQFPLLTHNPESMLKGDDGAVKMTKRQTRGADEAELGTYRNARNELCFPAVAFRTSLLTSLRGKKIKPGGGGRAIPAASHFKPALFVEPGVELLPILDPTKNWKPVTSYEVDTRRVVVKGAVPRSRPKFKNWGFVVPFLIDTRAVSPEQVEDALKEAGRIIGVGDYRIQCSGPFGGYAAELVTSKRRS